MKIKENQFKPIHLPVSFLEWVSFEGYLRLSEKAGHKWVKISSPVEKLTTDELYDLFIKSLEDEAREDDLKEHISHLEMQSRNFGGI